MPFRERTVLIIGGGGFIGNAVCARLASEGWQVHALVRSPIARPLTGVRYHVGDMGDRGFVEPLLRACNIVIHAASGTTPGSSSRSPVAELNQNLGPALRFLEIARENAPERILFLSSAGTLYADAAGPADEGAIPSARSYHGAGKIALEAFFRTFASDSGCGLVTLRPSNVYGPGQALRCGFGFVRTALEHALRGEPIEIWGDGSAVRDFLYLDDLVDALVAALTDDSVQGLFNVGNGKGYRLTEVVDIVGRVTGRPLDVVCRSGRRSDVHSARIEIGHITDVLGWRPRVDLDVGLARTWDWLRQPDRGRDVPRMA